MVPKANLFLILFLISVAGNSTTNQIAVFVLLCVRCISTFVSVVVAASLFYHVETQVNYINE